MEDLKSGFGLMGPTWIHDALSFTVSEERKQRNRRSGVWRSGAFLRGEGLARFYLMFSEG